MTEVEQADWYRDWLPQAEAWRAMKGQLYRLHVVNDDVPRIDADHRPEPPGPFDLAVFLYVEQTGDDVYLTAKQARKLARLILAAVSE